VRATALPEGGATVEVFAQIVASNRSYVQRGDHRPLPVRPARKLAIVTCMDARIPVFPIAGLHLGDAHIIRTAGARVTDDVLRSLALSTHVLGTRSVAVIGHTDCGVCDPEGTLPQRMAELLGHAPTTDTWHGFADPEQAVTEDCRKLLGWPDRPEGFAVAGYLLDVHEGLLRQVVAPAEAAEVGDRGGA
jgi:carbonic anhydrase